MNKVTISKVLICKHDVRMPNGDIVDGLQREYSYTFCVDPTPEDDDPIAKHFAKAVNLGFGKDESDVLEYLRIQTPDGMTYCGGKGTTLEQVRKLIQGSMKEAGK